VQWYPGHIAKAERNLREQLKAVDMVLEVRDGRCPMSTRHPLIPEWVGSKPRVLLINRKDMVPEADRAAWTDHFAARGHRALWTCGNMGDGVARVAQQAAALGERLNSRRAARGLRPRPVRAVVIGFPNVGKSALINRLLGRRVADSAPKPGVTRSLRWARIGGDIDLLDAPGIIPMSLKDQVAAQRLAMCNDIGEASYVDSLVAAAFLHTVQQLPSGPQIARRISERYKLRLDEYQEEEYVHALGDRMFNGEPERAGQRILKDFRTQALGKICLELPHQYEHIAEV
jgi:ribosome biogenesis GTPase A